MAQDLYAPRADAVEGELFVETRDPTQATAALWTLHGLTRQKPRPWIPTTVLGGESGSGRTTVATRFVRATQRNASCDLLRERAPGPDPESAKRDAEALTHASRWAARRAREFGSCPAICHTAAWVPRHLNEQAVAEAQEIYPAVRMQLEPRPDRDGLALGDGVWRSPTNLSHHATRRTRIMMVDDADRLFNVPASRRRGVLDRIRVGTRGSATRWRWC